MGQWATVCLPVRYIIYHLVINMCLCASIYNIHHMQTPEIDLIAWQVKAIAPSPRGVDNSQWATICLLWSITRGLSPPFTVIGFVVGKFRCLMVSVQLLVVLSVITDRLAHRHTDRRTDAQTDAQMHRQTDAQTDTHWRRLTYIHVCTCVSIHICTDVQTDRHTDTQTHEHTNRKSKSKAKVGTYIAQYPIIQIAQHITLYSHMYEDYLYTNIHHSL